MSVLRPTGARMLLLARALSEGVRRGISGREVLVQLFEMGTRSLWLVGLGLSALGLVMVMTGASQAHRLTGSLAMVGPAYLELLIREIAPLATVLLIATRAGAATAAELASMKVTEQIEALEMAAGDPLADLVAPRIIASAIAVPALCVLGIAAAAVSAMLTANWVYGTGGQVFVDARFVDRFDLLSAALKSILCGAYIPAAAAFRGLSASGGLGAAGAAVTQGVVDAALGCLVIDFLVSFAFLVVGA